MSSLYRKKGETVTRQIAGETLLVPIHGDLANMERIFALNPTAAYIWQRLDGAKGLGEIRKGLLANFTVEQDQAESDLGEFIGELLEAGLIEEVL